MAQCLFNRRIKGPTAGPGEREFLESGLFQVPIGVKKIEIFLVGGGGGGHYGWCTYNSDGEDERSIWCGGAGGGGGYIFHGFLDVTPKEILTIEIGDGGLGGGAVRVLNQQGSEIVGQLLENAQSGQPTTIKRGTDVIAQANGGGPAKTTSQLDPGGDGESGGGAGNYRGYWNNESSDRDYYSDHAPAQGGINGSNGVSVHVWYHQYRHETGREGDYDYDDIAGGTGTGLCTHLWRDPNEPEAFSGGGCGGEYDGSSPAIGRDGGGNSSEPGTPNTGGGGGGCEGQLFDYEDYNNMRAIMDEFNYDFQGGSGYAIVRWGFEEEE